MFDNAIKQLQEGKETIIKPRGNSMHGKIESGDIVHLKSCNPDDLSINDIVLVKVKGHIYLHLVKAIKKEKNQLKFQIGNNRGGINGWVGPNSIYGIAIKIEKPEK